MMKSLPISAGIIAIAVLAIGAAQAQDSGGQSGAETAPELAEGKAVYQQWCAPCHAANPRHAGTSALAIKYKDSDIPAALEDRTDLQPALITYFVRNGVAWMPPFRPTEISDAQLEQLNAYLTAPLDQRGEHASLLAEEMHAKRYGAVQDNHGETSE